MKYTTLVDAATLAAHRADPAWRVVDCRFELSSPDAGAAAYAAGHIEGAVYAHLDHDLAGPRSATSGRHPLPEPAALAATLGRLGIGAGTQVVAYDDAGGIYAARLWWLLRWLGHDAVAVLDGGLAAWRAAGGALTARPTTVAPTRSPRSSPATQARCSTRAPQSASRAASSRSMPAPATCPARAAITMRGTSAPTAASCHRTSCVRGSRRRSPAARRPTRSACAARA